MDQRQTFNRQLIQWASAYARAPSETENEPFRQVHSIVRDMESQKIAKPIIFYQIMMVLQALTCLMKVQFTEHKIKKILAILYPDEMYVSDLAKQVISAIGISVATVQMNPANEEVLERLRQSQAVNSPQSQSFQQNIGIQTIQQGRSVQMYGPPPGPYA